MQFYSGSNTSVGDHIYICIREGPLRQESHGACCRPDVRRNEIL